MISALYGCFYLAFYILSVLGCISVLGFVLPLSQNLDCISVFGLGFSIFEFCSFWFLSATVYIWWSSASKSKHWKQLTSVEHVLIRRVARFFTGRCDPRRRRTKRVRDRRSKSLGWWTRLSKIVLRTFWKTWVFLKFWNFKNWFFLWQRDNCIIIC